MDDEAAPEGVDGEEPGEAENDRPGPIQAPSLLSTGRSAAVLGGFDAYGETPGDRPPATPMATSNRK